jgi:Glycosyl transferases group 1
MDMHLHVVAFNVPYPPKYGGVIDVFYKLKALHDLGVRITLHAFQYRESDPSGLNDICDEIFLYQRKLNPLKLLSIKPFIVNTRNNSEIFEQLKKDEDPILLDGFHCTTYLNRNELGERDIYVRNHNIEHDYYNGLAKAQRNIIRKIYHKSEAIKLKNHEKILSTATGLFAISPNDNEYLNKSYGRSHLIPAFHPNDHLSIPKGIGDYAFYHGDLAVGENDFASQYLAQEVFNDIDKKLIIAGNRPSSRLQAIVERFQNIEIVNSPSHSVMTDLIKGAQVHVLPTFQATGIKLKLLTALFNGRWCVVSPEMVNETGLESCCKIAGTPDQMKREIIDLFEREISDDIIVEREKILSKNFSNRANAQKIVDTIFE